MKTARTLCVSVCACVSLYPHVSRCMCVRGAHLLFRRKRASNFFMHRKVFVLMQRPLNHAALHSLHRVLWAVDSSFCITLHFRVPRMHVVSLCSTWKRVSFACEVQRIPFVSYVLWFILLLSRNLYRLPVFFFFFYLPAKRNDAQEQAVCSSFFVYRTRYEIFFLCRT